MNSGLIRILRLLDLSSKGNTLKEITMHTNAKNPLLLLEILINKGFVRKASFTDALGSTQLRFMITSKGHSHLSSSDSEMICISLSCLEKALLKYELDMNHVLRSY